MVDNHTCEDVRRQLQAYLQHEMGRGALQEWLLDFLSVEDGPADALALGWKAERVLMEESRGEHSEDELREELAELAYPRSGASLTASG